VKPKRRENPQWRTRQMLRKRINVSTRLNVEAAGDGKERLICRKCGWTKVQNVGDMTDEQIAQSNKTFLDKLVAYRGHSGGIWGICEACTRRVRDEQYPMDCIPRYL
jgi:hypothetical protein